MTKPILDVAIAVLMHRNKVLVGWREATQHQGNKYEFPGGKVEKNETPIDACRRETREEVGLDISVWHAFDVIRHEYEDLHVHLHIFHAVVPLEKLDAVQNTWSWYTREELKTLNFPKANDEIINRLNWSRHIKIASELEQLNLLSGTYAFDTWMYLRVVPHNDLIDKINALPISMLNKLIVNIELWQDLDISIQKQLAAVQFKHDQLLNIEFVPVSVRSIASCHDELSVKHAQIIGCDAILLSPVHSTKTHLDAKALGWEQFKRLSFMSQVPVFALGGLSPSDLDLAKTYGAYGVAGIRNF